MFPTQHDASSLAPLSHTAPSKDFCFVLTPSGTAFDEAYRLGIQEASIKTGTYCDRHANPIFEADIHQIHHQIAHASIVIADITGQSPNVLYGLGYAHALGKPTILLKQNQDDHAPFTKNAECIVYGNTLKTLKDRLAIRITRYLQKVVPENQTPLIDLFTCSQSLASGTATCYYPTTQFNYITIAVHNNSPHYVASGDFKIAIITDSKYSYLDSRPRIPNSILLPGNQTMHMFPNFEALFPYQYTSFAFHFGNHVAPPIETEKVVLRVFTKTQAKDFDLTILPPRPV